jgi:hypothetical protein
MLRTMRFDVLLFRPRNVMSLNNPFTVTGNSTPEHGFATRNFLRTATLILKKDSILRPAYEAEVGHGMNKGLRVFDRSLSHQIGPKLAGEIELGVDLQSQLNIDVAISFLRSVVQFTKDCMAGAGIVPCV